MRLLVLGPPGAGKGTHGVRLAAELGIAHISSGDLLRAEIDRATPLGSALGGYVSRGELVPDKVLLELMVPVVVRAAEQTGGYIGDGFPRTLAQAERAHKLIGIDNDLPLQAVISLEVHEAALVERVLARAAMQGRADDTAEVITRRLAIFREHTLPLLEYYAGRELLVPIDGNSTSDEVYAAICSALAERGIRPRPSTT